MAVTKFWKESLNSDGQQFHQYQQNEQPTLILTELTKRKKKKTMTCDVRKLGPGLGQKQKCGGVEPVNEIPTLLSW